MVALGFIVTIGSENPERLIPFYQGVVGLQPLFEMTPGAFALPGTDSPVLIIEPHDHVHGPATEPHRLLLNFLVDDMVAEAERIRACGVAFEREPYEEQAVGWFATFSDLDGNLCQLVQLYN
jgi:predicted enzyme related to lactoylglutathione lyase